MQHGSDLEKKIQQLVRLDKWALKFRFFESLTQTFNNHRKNDQLIL